MRRLLIGLAVFATVALFAMPALADHSPGTDECSHGASDQDCREDPNENGQDCEEHGNEGGVNEDHCTTTETTTTTVVIPPPETETTTTTTTVIVPPVDTTTSVTEVPTTTSEVPTSTTTRPTRPSGTSSGPGSKSPPLEKESTGKLAFTGIEDVVPIGVAALALLSGGSGALWLGSRRRRDS